KRIPPRLTEAAGSVEVADSLRLGIVRDVDARTGVFLRIAAANHEIEAPPRGFNGLESRMVQQAAHSLAERRNTAGVGYLLRRCTRPRQIPNVLLEGVAATDDLLQQAGGTQQFAHIRLRSCALRFLGPGSRIEFAKQIQVAVETIGVKVIE